MFFFSLCRRSIGISAVHMRACSVVLLCLNNLLLIFFYIEASSLEIALYIDVRETLQCICNCVPLLQRTLSPSPKVPEIGWGFPIKTVLVGASSKNGQFLRLSSKFVAHDSEVHLLSWFSENRHPNSLTPTIPSPKNFIVTQPRDENVSRYTQIAYHNHNNRPKIDHAKASHWF